MSRIEEIKARCEVATPGPWVRNDEEFYARICAKEYDGDIAHVGVANDADFIAHSRDDIPWLLGEVARLTAERDAAVRRAEATEADLVLAMENSNSFMSCEPCVHRGYDPDDGLCCKLKSCKPKWRGPEPGGEEA